MAQTVVQCHHLSHTSFMESLHDVARHHTQMIHECLALHIPVQLHSLYIHFELFND